MPGRYGVSSRSDAAHVRASQRVSRTRVTLLSCSAVVVGALGLADTATAPDASPDALAAPPASDRDAGELSRGNQRDEPVAAKALRVPGPEFAAPAPTSTPEPNVKPPATAPLPSNSGSGHRVVFDITGQQVWLVGDGNVVKRTYMVSGSRFDQVPTGTFEVFSKSRDAVSWHGTETMEYMVRFHRGENSNIGFHDIPVKTETGNEVQTLSQLGTPLSDGCIRQDLEDAVALWKHAPVGTPVVVVRT
ncbi:lipoprotein-anchoring transpeptidase ErfK/SrfK [Haloactinopolyspora alba]|uniref:Lipoprotein-anchoring transpeptidase ErfK/SrfK n=1 Tax=Haloactinopolyspora alba TaxID=648780 RepID=A0A2P8DXE5_9ACTN|nr:L,D-transpeptidase [Haloactinopolyspora alba]PSL01894.1 lipoprotein-anchoring transpeptidase ErfK/SrfK [Haloactinopolyspora alba]